MKQSIIKRMIWGFCGTILLASPLFSQIQMKENRAAVAIQLPSLAEDMQLREERAEEDLYNQEHQDQIPLEDFPVQLTKKVLGEEDDSSEISSEFKEKIKSKSFASYYYTYNTHQGAYHYPVNVTTSGIEIEDGSIWEIKWGDRHKIAHWKPEHRLIIVPNRSWFSSYYFKFVNIDKDEEIVCANLSEWGPILNSPYTHWIEEIDYGNNVLRLEDGSYWSISWLDSGVLQAFDLYDVVIIGTNDGWWKSSRPNILISVKSFKYARGIRTH